MRQVAYGYDPLTVHLKEFLRLLSDHHVEYLLIGGYAVSYHGYPRTTDDMDIWIAIGQENAKRVIATLEEFGFGGLGITPEQFLPCPIKSRAWVDGRLPLRF